jgi:hypothetical protein
MTNQQLAEIHQRESFEFLGEDIAPLEEHLRTLNEARGLTDNADIVQPSLDEQINRGLTDLAEQYQPLQHATVRWASIGARAILGGQPNFLHESGHGVPESAHGYFAGFQLLDTPMGHCRLYMRAVQGIQVFWAQPTPKNFSQ